MSCCCFVLKKKRGRKRGGKKSKKKVERLRARKPIKLAFFATNFFTEPCLSVGLEFRFFVCVWGFSSKAHSRACTSRECGHGSEDGDAEEACGRWRRSGRKRRRRRKRRKRKCNGAAGTDDGGGGGDDNSDDNGDDGRRRKCGTCCSWHRRRSRRARSSSSTRCWTLRRRKHRRSASKGPILVSSPWVSTLVCRAMVRGIASFFSFSPFFRRLFFRLNLFSFLLPISSLFLFFPPSNRRLKVHYRAPPDIRGSGKERGHGTELQYCPRCGKELKAGKHHVGCFAGRSAPRQAAKRFRLVSLLFFLFLFIVVGEYRCSLIKMRGVSSVGMLVDGAWDDLKERDGSTTKAIPFFVLFFRAAIKKNKKSRRSPVLFLATSTTTHRA